MAWSDPVSFLTIFLGCLPLQWSLALALGHHCGLLTDPAATEHWVLCDASFSHVVFQYSSVTSLTLTHLLSSYYPAAGRTVRMVLENILLPSASLVYLFRRGARAVSLCLTLSSALGIDSLLSQLAISSPHCSVILTTGLFSPGHLLLSLQPSFPWRVLLLMANAVHLGSKH